MLYDEKINLIHLALLSPIFQSLEKIGLGNGLALEKYIWTKIISILNGRRTSGILSLH